MTDVAGTIEIAMLPERAGMRIGRFLADQFPLEPEELILALFAAGKVEINGDPRRPKHTLRKNDIITVRDLEAVRATCPVEVTTSAVLYEDAHILVLDKPSGCTSVRDRTGRSGDFQNGVLQYIRSTDKAASVISHRYRPRAVHRLDRDTTGAIIFAISREGELHLARQFRERTIIKEYIVIVHGELREDTGEIRHPIGPDRHDISRMRIDHQAGKETLTVYELAERFRGYTLAHVRLHTGRRHQIRIHFAANGHPVAGDLIYGGSMPMLSRIKRGYNHKRGREEKSILARPALHAHAITFLPVGADTPIRVESPLPKDISILLKMLRKFARGGARSPAFGMTPGTDCDTDPSPEPHNADAGG